MAGVTFAKAHIDTATTTQVKDSGGVLRKVVVNDIGTSFTVDVYDATSGTANQVAAIDATEIATLEFDCFMNNGIRVISGGTPGSVTIIYE